LPEALRNYLARLGWSHGDDEIFSDAQAIAWFDIADVNKGAARLDWDKLASVNAHYIREADPGRLAKLVLAVHDKRGTALDDAGRARLEQAMGMMRDRGKTTLELADQTEFLLKQRPLALDARTHDALTEEARARLGRLAEKVSAAATWDPAALEAEIKAFAESEGVGLGKIGPALRGVLAGGSPAPDLGRTLAALGREEALGRIQDALSSAA